MGGVTVSCPRSKSKRRSKGGVLTQNARQMTHEIKKRMGAKTRLLNVFRALYLSADRRGWLSPHTCGRWRRSPRVQRALNQDQHCRRQQHCTAPTPAPRWRPYIYIPAREERGSAVQSRQHTWSFMARRKPLCWSSKPFFREGLHTNSRGSCPSTQRELTQTSAHRDNAHQGVESFFSKAWTEQHR